MPGPPEWEELPHDKDWKRMVLRLRFRIQLVQAQDLEKDFLLIRDKNSRRSCYHDKQFHTHHQNPHATQCRCDIDKGGCGAIIMYVHKHAAGEEVNTRKLPEPFSQRLRKTLQQEENNPKDKYFADMFGPKCPRCFRMNKGGRLQRFRTTFNQTVLVCSRWFEAKDPCRIMQALPGEKLPEGKPTSKSKCGQEERHLIQAQQQTH